MPQRSYASFDLLKITADARGSEKPNKKYRRELASRRHVSLPGWSTPSVFESTLCY